MRFAAFLLVALVACKGGGGEPALKPGPRPDTVVAAISISSYGGVVEGAEEMLRATDSAASNAMVSGGMLRMQLDRASGMERYQTAIDSLGPMHIVILAAPGQAPERVLIGRHADLAELRRVARGEHIRTHDQWAAIGTRAAVEAVAPWALTELVKAPPHMLDGTDAVHAHIWMTAVRRAGHAGPGEGALAPISGDDTIGALFEYIGRGVQDALHQSDAIDVTIAPSVYGVRIDVALTPTPGSTLAGFVAAQRPATFELLLRMPLAGATTIVAGTLARGPLRDPLLTGLLPWLPTILGGDATPAQRTAVDELLAATTGELAAVHAEIPDAEADAPGHPAWHATLLFGLDDPATATARLATLTAPMEQRPAIHVSTLGFPAQVTPAGPRTFDGARWLAWRTDLDDTRGLEALEQLGHGFWAHGAWDRHAALIVSANPIPIIESLVSATRAPAAAETDLSADLLARLTDARQARASLLISHGGAWHTLSFADGVLRWRGNIGSDFLSFAQALAPRP